MKNVKWNSYWDSDNQVPNDLKIMEGATITDIEGVDENSESVVFYLDNGYAVQLYHQQDCCEGVSLVDFVGDPNDLIEGYVVEAREDSNADGPVPEYHESYTWTFYNIVTNKGTLTLRWLGESNGYYSESVDVLVGVIQE